MGGGIIGCSAPLKALILDRPCTQAHSISAIVQIVSVTLRMDTLIGSSINAILHNSLCGAFESYRHVMMESRGHLIVDPLTHHTRAAVVFHWARLCQSGIVHTPFARKRRLFQCHTKKNKKIKDAHSQRENSPVPLFGVTVCPGLPHPLGTRNCRFNPPPPFPSECPWHFIFSHLNLSRAHKAKCRSQSSG